MRIAIIGCVRIYREGIAALVRKQHHVVELSETASSINRILAELKSQQVDAVLIDAATREYLSIGHSITAQLSIKVIGLALSENEAEIIACAEAGFSGYVARDASAEELLHAINAAEQGELICPPNIVGCLLRRVHTLASRRGSQPEVPNLTNREIQIAQLIESGHSNKEIARKLHIEVSTVKNHIHNLLDKLKVHRRGEAAARLRDLFPKETSDNFSNQHTISILST